MQFYWDILQCSNTHCMCHSGTIRVNSCGNKGRADMFSSQTSCGTVFWRMLGSFARINDHTFWERMRVSERVLEWVAGYTLTPLLAYCAHAAWPRARVLHSKPEPRTNVERQASRISTETGQIQCILTYTHTLWCTRIHTNTFTRTLTHTRTRSNILWALHFTGIIFVLLILNSVFDRMKAK